MLPKRNKGPPASPGEKRWDRLHSVAIWLEMSYKILTHWTWLNCKKLSPRKEIFVTQEVSDSSSARLVTWHSQRAVRIAWYCHPESKEKIVPWNQHGQAQLITLPWHQGALQLLLQATALLWECFPPLWAGADSVPGPDSAQQLPRASAPGLVWGRPSTGSSPEPDVQHRLCHAGHWAGACAEPSDIPDPTYANVLLANMLHKSKWNGRFWTDKQTALREHFLPEIPAQTQNTCNLCNLSLSKAPRAKWES